MNQLSRKYNKRVEIWKTTKFPDGYGGSIPSDPVLQKTVWMNVITNVGKRATELGLTDAINTVLFEMRYREGINPEDTFFKYKGERYVLKAPQNKNALNRELIVYGTRQ